VLAKSGSASPLTSARRVVTASAGHEGIPSSSVGRGTKSHSKGSGKRCSSGTSTSSAAKVAKSAATKTSTPSVSNPPVIDYFGQGHVSDVHLAASKPTTGDAASVTSSRASKFVSVEQFSSLSDRLDSFMNLFASKFADTTATESVTPSPVAHAQAVVPPSRTVTTLPGFTAPPRASASPSKLSGGILEQAVRPGTSRPTLSSVPKPVVSSPTVDRQSESAPVGEEVVVISNTSQWVSSQDDFDPSDEPEVTQSDLLRTASEFCHSELPSTSVIQPPVLVNPLASLPCASFGFAVPLQKRQRISLSHSQSLAGSFLPPFDEAVKALKTNSFLGKSPVTLPQLFDSHGQQVPKRGEPTRLESEICPSVVADKPELAFLRLQHGLLSELHDRNQHVCVLVEAILSTLLESLPAFPALGALFSVLGSTLTSTTCLWLTSLT
jgi:hypothetical protein